MENLNLPKYLTSSKSLLTPNHCNSSWGLAITQMMSDRLYKRSKGLTLKGFSLQALLNCGAGTCEKGDPFNALVFIHKYGIPE